jgi:hypothetical protein
MQNEIESKLSENVHYEIIPSDDKHGWNIRLMEEFPETVLSFDVIELVEDEEQISFNFTIVYTPDTDLSVESLPLQEYTGRILTSLLEVAVSDGTLVAQDKKTGDVLASNELQDEMEEIYNEYQSGTNDSEESTNE